MLTPAVNVEVVAKKPDMKSSGVDLHNAAEVSPDKDFAKSLRLVLFRNEVSRDSLALDKEGNQVKVADLIQKFSDGKDMLGEDVISMLEQLMAQFQIGGGIQASLLSRQGTGGQGVNSLAAYLPSLPQLLSGLNQGPANSEFKAVQLPSAEDKAAQLAEAFKGVMKGETAAPVLNPTGKIDISDFKLLLSDTSKNLQAMNKEVDFTVLGEKEFSLLDAMPKEIAVEKLVKGGEASVFEDKDLLKIDSNDNFNLTSLSGAGAAQNDNKNVTVVKDAININRLMDIDIPIMKTVEGGGKHLLVRLDPPDLGSVQIKLSLDNGVLRADFKVESSAIKDLFTANMPHIKASLENSGLKVGEFFVDVREEGFYYSDDGRQGGNKDDSKQQQQKQQQQATDEKFNFSDLFA